MILFAFSGLFRRGPEPVNKGRHFFGRMPHGRHALRRRTAAEEAPPGRKVQFGAPYRDASLCRNVQIQDPATRPRFFLPDAEALDGLRFASAGKEDGRSIRFCQRASRAESMADKAAGSGA